MIKYVLGILLVLGLSGCLGFTPVYQSTAKSEYQKFAQIDIMPAYTVLEQQLYNALLDRQANFDLQKSRYTLHFEIEKTTRTLSSFVDGNASSIRANYITRYTLKHGESKIDLQSNTTTNYSTDNSLFSNELLIEKADAQAMNVLADTIMKRLNLFFQQNPNWS